MPTVLDTKGEVSTVGFGGMSQLDPDISFATACGFVLLASTLGALFAYDLHCRRLPDYLTLGLWAQAVVWSLVVGKPHAVFFGLGWFLIYVLVGVCVGGIGGGDIKLALGLGTLAGLVGAGAVFVAIMGANLLVLCEHAVAVFIASYRRGRTHDQVGWQVTYAPLAAGLGHAHGGVSEKLIYRNATAVEVRDCLQRLPALKKVGGAGRRGSFSFAHGPHMIIATAGAMVLAHWLCS